MNLASWITVLVVLIMVILIVRNMIKEKGSGKCNCGCSACGGACPHCLPEFKKKGNK